MNKKSMPNEVFGKLKVFLPHILIMVLTIAVYYNGLTSEFQLDDNHVVLNNTQVTNLSNFLNYSTWSKIFFNRAFAYLTVAVNYSIHEYSVLGYHILNIIIHLLNCLMIFLILKEILKSPVVKNQLPAGHENEIIFFAVLIFALHPLQVQAVTYITQRMVSLSVLFYLLALYLYIRLRSIPFDKSRLPRIFLLGIGIIASFLLSNYSKEIALSFPLAVILVEEFFIRTKEGKRDLRIIGALVLAVAVGVIIFILKEGSTKQTEVISRSEYFLTELNVLVTYIRLFFLPFDLHVFYDYPIYRTLFNVNTLFSAIILLSLLAAAFYFKRRITIISFCVFWFFLTQIIESSIFTLEYIIFEYRVYPALFAFGLLISYSSFYFISKHNLSRLILSLFIAFLAFFTIDYNSKWKDGATLWYDNIQKAPNHPKPYNFLGAYLLMHGDRENSFAYFSKSIELDTNYAEPYDHRGVIFKERGNLPLALKDFNKSIKIDSKNCVVYNNRGYAYLDFGFTDLAIDDFEKAVQLLPGYHNAWKNLSVALQRKQNYEYALKCADRSIKLFSKNESYFNNRGNIYFALGNLDLAGNDFLSALRINPSYDKALNNYGLVLFRKKLITQSIEYFSQAINSNPNYFDAYRNRAYGLLLIGQRELAIKDLNQCHLLNPSDPSIYQLKSIFKIN